MPAAKKSWQEKLKDSKDLPKVVKITGKMAGAAGSCQMVVPAPILVDALMKQVPKGKLVTNAEIQQALAVGFDVEKACPLTTGIFAWIAAHAAQESLDQGKKQVTPFWRTLKAKGELNPKFPGGLAHIKTLLEAEGHQVVTKGKRMFVANYEKRLAQLKPDKLQTKKTAANR